MGIWCVGLGFLYWGEVCEIGEVSSEICCFCLGSIIFGNVGFD